MAPGVLSPRFGGIYPELSKRSDSVQLSLDAWQIVGIALAVLCLIGLIIGWFVWQKRSKTEETELPPLRGKGTDGTNTTEEERTTTWVAAQGQEARSPEQSLDKAEAQEDAQSPGVSAMEERPNTKEETQRHQQRTPGSELSGDKAEIQEDAGTVGGPAMEGRTTDTTEEKRGQGELTPGPDQSQNKREPREGAGVASHEGKLE